MKRLFVSLVLALAAPLAAPIHAKGARAWTAVATPAPQGSYVIGNPGAKVKLIEYVSYTCPHCGHFAAESAATLKGKMIASGSTSLEVRNSVHDKFDLAAATLARCSGPAIFPQLHEQFYARQSAWLDRAVAFDQANGQRLALYGQLAALRALADGAGLSEIATAAGMSGAAIDRCFADETAVQRTLQVAQAVSGKVRSTPTFELDGRLIENVAWAKLEPMLRAAGAR